MISWYLIARRASKPEREQIRVLLVGETGASHNGNATDLTSFAALPAAKGRAHPRRGPGHYSDGISLPAKWDRRSKDRQAAKSRRRPAVLHRRIEPAGFPVAGHPVAPQVTQASVGGAARLLS